MFLFIKIARVYYRSFFVYLHPSVFSRDIRGQQAVSSTIQRINSKIQLTCKDVVYYDGDYKCNLTNTGPDENKRGKLTEVISLRTKC